MRIIFSSLLIVILSAVIGLGVLLDWYYSKIQPQQQDPAKQISQQTLSRIATNYAALIASKPELANIYSDEHLTIEIGDKANFPLPEELRNAFETNALFSLNSADKVSVHSYQRAQDKVVSFYIDNPQETPIPDSNNMLLTLLYYAGLIVFISIWLIPLVRRLYSLNNAMLRFGEGKVQSRVKPSSFSYIADIESGFNTMAKRIEDLITDNKLLSRAVSHDLRTPIASLRFGTEMLSETTRDDQQLEYVSRMNRDLDAMEALVENLIAFARLEQADIPLSPEIVDFDMFMQNLITDIRTNKAVNLIATNVGCNVLLDKRYSKMMIDNIVLNACKYARSQVAINIVENADDTILIIEDDGPGIPRNEHEQVLKPFYQIDKSHKGHGMGLAIASRIASWLNADLSLSKSEALGGLKISITFARS